MRLPNKINTYKESIIAKFPLFLEILKKQKLSPLELYKKTKSKVDDIGEFMEILECLYALGKIEFDVREGVLHYVG